MYESLFEISEYQSRLERLRNAMDSNSVDMLVICDPNNIFYISGYNGMSHYVPQALIITPSRHMLVLREMDVRGANITSWFDSSMIVGYDDRYLMSSEETPWHFITNQMASLNSLNGNIGYDRSGTFISPASWDVIASLLPNAKLEDTTLMTNWVRAEKSSSEIAYMREAGAVSDAALEAGIGFIAPDARECDVAGEITKTLIAGTKSFGGGIAYPPNMPAGDRVVTPHLLWTDSPYGQDTQVNIEVGGMRHWYTSPASRTVCLGKPTDGLLRLEEATISGMEAALAKVAPGVACEEIELSFRQQTKKFGYEKISRIGYAVGLGFLPPGWIEMTSSLAPGDKTIMKPGMTYHMMLGMWFGDENLVVSESFVVTETGAESFSKLPRQISVKEL